MGDGCQESFGYIKTSIFSKVVKTLKNILGKSALHPLVEGRKCKYTHCTHSREAPLMSCFHIGWNNWMDSKTDYWIDKHTLDKKPNWKKKKYLQLITNIKEL